MDEPSTSIVANSDNEDDVFVYRCEQCIHCMVTKDCGQCEQCTSSKPKTCKERRCFFAADMYAKEKGAKIEAKENEKAVVDNSDTCEMPEKKKRGRKKGWKKAEHLSQKAEKAEAVQQRKEKEKEEDTPAPRTKLTRNQIAHAHNTERKNRAMGKQEEKFRHCLGPDCILSARPNSKYCSDECGKQLAKMRLVEILPLRTTEYFGVASDGEQHALEAHHRVKKEFELLAESERKLMGTVDKISAYIEKMSTKEPSSTAENDSECDMYMSCIVCGQVDVQTKKYAKHVENCWVKLERAVSYGTSEKTECQTNIFCDVYDKKQNTYCKRLKALCPEHRKPGPEKCLKVCAHPLKWELAGSITPAQIIEEDDPFGDSCCMVDARNCTKHYKWIPTLLAVIQSEQANLLFKKYELMNEAQKIWYFQQWHTNVLTVLTHKHNPDAAKSVDQS